MDFGRLRERITIQVATETRNAMRETVQEWGTFAERWASVEGISSREALQQGQQMTEITHRIRMRYLDGLKSTMQVLWRGRTLQITSLLEHGNRSVHELLCTERVA